MTDNELKKLNRSELLQMLIRQMKENEELEAQLTAARTQLQDRQIHIDKAGTLAEAALLLNGVFEAAEAAGQQYTENIKLLSERQQSVCEKMEAESREKAAKILAEAEEKAAKLVSDAEKRSRAVEINTKKKCAEMITKAKTESEAYWEEASHRLEAFSAEHSELMELLSHQLLKRK